jgi:N-acetyl sugar amidotransferase
MNYCKKCILPDLRPGIVLNNDGICSGCEGHEIKKYKIDWKEREKLLFKIFNEAKKKSTTYDCIVPVSGGKDSWYQIITAKKFGLSVLALTWITPARTSIGEENLKNMLDKLKVDHIDYSFSNETEKKFMVATFEKLGSPGLPMHLGIFTMCTRMSILLKIPLIIWGENSQLEYGGNKEDQLQTDLNDEWLSKHGCMEGTGSEDWVGINGLTKENLIPYSLPKVRDYIPKSIFLGSFLKWNSFDILEQVKKYGFRYDENHGKVGAWNFADIDCDFISLHHFLKWHKFGMTRSFDNLSIQIRYELINREKAISKIKEMGHFIPHDDIKKFCNFVKKPTRWFFETCEKFRNKRIWYKDRNTWKIKNFLISDWKWNED